MTDFRSFIANLIAPCGLDSHQLELLLDPLSLELYTKAFTHVSYDAHNHYEVYEQLGDITVNKFLVWYFHHRLAQHGTLFHSTLGVKVVARLRIKYGSKQQLSELADRLGFWTHIRITENVSQGKRLSILEDVFEAFVGVTEYLVDSRLMVGLGYIICYRILQSFFDPMTIDISYEQLFDAKTRLKELFDVYRDQLGSLHYEYEKQSHTGHAWVQIARTPPGTQNKVVICAATHPINKALAEQQASEDALGVLSRQGYTRDIPLEYRQMLSHVTTSVPVEGTTRGDRR
jgi:dsRNA-specific ribonuclease